MSISYEVLLEKMELELKKARQADGLQQLQGHMYALKALAELILESKAGGAHVSIFDRKPVAEEIRPISVAGSEPLKTEDGSNGDSLFDF